MFSLYLLRFSPITKESHLIVVLLGLAAFCMDYLLVPAATAVTSFSTAIMVGCSWYVFKLFDGLCYDGTETVHGTVLGLGSAISLCAGYFLF